MARLQTKARKNARLRKKNYKILKRKSYLSTQNVHQTFIDCLFREEELNNDDAEIPEGAILVTGMTNRIGFNPERIRKNRSKIIQMLNDLPPEFKKGDSFLNACNNKKGLQWTSFHKSMEELFLLGMAINRVSFPLPRSCWALLPGSVPIVIVHDKDHILKSKGKI